LCSRAAARREQSRANPLAARIETISYKETREYVARVLAFSTIYDWRLNGNAIRLSDRMRGITTGARKQFACPLALPTAKPAT
jgi:soluble lytic murein transglycosylase